MANVTINNDLTVRGNTNIGGCINIGGNISTSGNLQPTEATFTLYIEVTKNFTCMIYIYKDTILSISGSVLNIITYNFL